MTQVNANEITEAIEKATVKMNQYLAETGEDYYCGFAWVNVIVTRTNSAQAKELMQAGFRKCYLPRTLQYWGSPSYHGQSMSVREIFSDEFAMLLRAKGLNAHAGSRAD